MSVDALASSWARAEGAPDGAVVVLDNEISGRVRGGEPWTLGGPDGFMMAMVARPVMDPLDEALLWLAASLAAADASAAATGADLRLLWPDRAIDPTTAALRCAVNVVVQLGPGRVEHAIFAVRVDLRCGPSGDPVRLDPDSFVPAYVTSARRYVQQLSSAPESLRANYAERCAQIGERVRVELLPRGEVRGRVTAVDQDGFCVLESPTGMLERIAPGSLRSIEFV